MSAALPLQRRINAMAFTLVLVSVTLLVCLYEARHSENWASKPEPEAKQVTMTVTATAYNSLYGQGAGADHALAAWGDRLTPGMKAIAVSRDLIEKGLVYNTPVTIEELPGTWYVKDKMHRRWKKKIDVYMGEDIKAAREWGKRKVTIRFTPKTGQ